MTDPFLTRDWADQHERFSDHIAAAIGKVLETIRVGLARGNAYDFDAPWQHDAKRSRKPRGPASA